MLFVFASSVLKVGSGKWNALKKTKKKHEETGTNLRVDTRQVSFYFSIFPSPDEKTLFTCVVAFRQSKTFASPMNTGAIQ